MIHESRLYSQVVSYLNNHVADFGQIFLVGGAVRDAVLKKDSIDLDFCIEKNAITAARLLADLFNGDFYVLDDTRETARAIIKHEGEKTKIDFTSLGGKTIEEDLTERDFTINAMAINICSPDQLIDPLTGLRHLEEKQIRACSPNSFINDSVRTLRAVRFIVSMGFGYDPEMVDSIKRAADFLGQVSSERKRDEIFRIFSDTRICESIPLLTKFGVFKEIFPELIDLEQLIPGPPHVHNVLKHTFRTTEVIQDIFFLLSEEQEKTGNPYYDSLQTAVKDHILDIHAFLSFPIHPDRGFEELMVLAALFHDTGKPDTLCYDSNHRMKFPGHAERSADIAELWARQMALSNEEIDFLVKVISHHMKNEYKEFTSVEENREKIHLFFRDTGKVGLLAGWLHLADLIATYEQNLTDERWQKGIHAITVLTDAWFNHQEDIVNPVRVLNGDDLMNEFRLKPGKDIGDILERVRIAQVSGKVWNKKTALDFASRIIKELN